MFTAGVFCIALYKFFKDETTPGTHLESWIFLPIIALLWPLTLPTILRKKLLAKSGGATVANLTGVV
ncbi:MAG: hypothetical protein HC839_03140 [Leptolyngbyaceae cyanobacterium RM2_2_21]|nr:hypothetical protein [Leptolyngbyaceae cyanobacterium RM2_2_21]